MTMARPAVRISFPNHGQSSQAALPEFPASGRIDGHVYIYGLDETPFSHVEIAFLGYNETCVDRLSSVPHQADKPDAVHNFLSLRHHIDRGALPQHPSSSSNSAISGRPCGFPFAFTVPDRLPSQACQHAAHSDVRRAHLRLPPSMGVQDGHSTADRFTPATVRIFYVIRARLVVQQRADEHAAGTTTTAVVISEDTRPILIRPSYSPDDALSSFAWSNAQEEYKLRGELAIRCGAFKAGKKKGRLAVETHACTTRLPDPGMLRVKVQFEPSNGSGQDLAPPPALGDLGLKLVAMTFYSSEPLPDFPSKEQLRRDATQAMCAKTVALSTRRLTAVQWQRGGGGVYTTYLTIPVLLPDAAPGLIPTFYGCFTSRIYRLDLSLSVSPTSSVALKIPLHLS